MNVLSIVKDWCAKAKQVVKPDVDISNIEALEKQIDKLSYKMEQLQLKRYKNHELRVDHKDYELFRFLQREIKYHYLALKFITGKSYSKETDNPIGYFEVNYLFPIVLAYSPIFRPYSKFGKKNAQQLSDKDLYQELKIWMNV